MAKGDKKKKGQDNVSTPNASLSKLEVSEVSIAQDVVADLAAGKEKELAESPTVPQAQPVLENEAKEAIKDINVFVNIIIERYEGEKVNGVFHGDGVAHFQGGHVYKGVFSDGLMHGPGEYIWANGVRYKGEFVANSPMGVGTYTWLDGSYYEGEVLSGIRHGTGMYRCGKTSVTYRGQWHQGQRHGKGIIYYNPEVTSWYEGDWVNNIKEGWGVRCYPSGNIYEGQWKNDMRDGQGRMRWLQLGQQYSGDWKNGIQHGQGTHTWFLRRVAGTQYPLRNEYVGEFVQGLRHGHGVFSYASGAVYSGGWKDNKKHGQGTFTFKNGRIFEGEFVDDRMAEFPTFCMDGFTTPDLSGIRTHTPTSCEDGHLRQVADSAGYVSVLGPDVSLDISMLLEDVPEDHQDAELKQVEFAVLRHIAELRGIYTFYSSLALSESPDNTFLLTRLQLWRLLLDCRVHHHGLTLADMDRLINGLEPSEEPHSPFSTMLLRNFISSLVIIAYHTFQKEDGWSSGGVIAGRFSKLMRDNIIPNAKHVKGYFCRDPMRAVIAVNYINKNYEIYKIFCQANSLTHPKETMTMRQFVLMLKDLHLFGSDLTPRTVIQILALENPSVYADSFSNMDVEIVFLEFYEALLGCAEAKQHKDPQLSEGNLSEDTISQNASDTQASSQNALGTGASPQTGSIVKSSNQMSSGRSTTKLSEVRRSREATHSTHTPDKATACRPSPEGNCSEVVYSEVEPVSDTLVQSMAALDPKDTLQWGGGSQGSSGGGELESWIQRTHHFFNKLFFPAYEHMLLLNRAVEEQRLREVARSRIALAKAKEAARLRELQEAEERRREEEEEEAAEKAAEAQEEDGNTLTPPAVSTPVASVTSMAPASKQPQSPGSAKKKKK
ncbi:radial spoke head 10 homolog B [Engraulis encrasicolus]|uniref:radial spoke head 10 homolog B n=1 Tax=Engraulis encrasicolus TaxID=184585 RepID=UPI002FCF8935